MTPNLTASDQDLDRLIRQTPKGTDPTATCNGCRHYGYEVATRNEAGNIVSAHTYNTRCALYKNTLDTTVRRSIRRRRPADISKPGSKMWRTTWLKS